MNSFISFLFVIICTVVLAAQQSQAKKGCNAYGHACYGGHGKRSLGSLVDGGSSSSSSSGTEAVDLRPDAIMQVFPHDVPISLNGENDAYPRYHLIKIIKSWITDHPRPRSSQHRNSEIDYSFSAESYNRDNINPIFN